MMVQIGNQNQWVNPKYVTSIEDCIMGPATKSKVWVVVNAGYGTYCIFSNLAPCEVAAKLNGQADLNEE